MKNETQSPLTALDLAGRVIRESKVSVDPGMASEWLLLNEHNRPVKRDKVTTFAHDMEIGQWRYVGDPIRFADKPDGGEILIDGQNRLLAVVKSGQTIHFKVERGYAPEDQHYIDIGTARSASDQLALIGYEHPQTTAAIARRIWNWENNGDPTSARGRVSNQVLRLLVANRQELLAPAARFGSSKNGGLLTGSIHGFLYYVLSQIDADEAEHFLTRVEDGAGMSGDHPVMALRRRVIRDRSATGRRTDDFYLIAYAFIAWNAMRRGRTLNKIQLPKGGLSLDNYPRPE